MSSILVGMVGDVVLGLGVLWTVVSTEGGMRVPFMVWVVRGKEQT